jgi:hypothetical protein
LFDRRKSSSAAARPDRGAGGAGLLRSPSAQSLLYDVVIEDREFDGFGGHPPAIIVAAYKSSFCESVYVTPTGEKAWLGGIVPDHTRIANIRFKGPGEIRLHSRGIVGDTVEIGGISGTGARKCKVAGFIGGTLTPPGTCGWANGYPKTTAPPKVVHLDSSILCK